MSYIAQKHCEQVNFKVMRKLAADEQLVRALQELNPQRQSEILLLLIKIARQSNPELMEIIIDQLETERQGDWWNQLTDEDKQWLEQSIREGEEGKTVGHERVQRAVRTRTAR